MKIRKQIKTRTTTQPLELRIKMREEKNFLDTPEEKHFPRRVKESPKIMHHLKKTVFA